MKYALAFFGLMLASPWIMEAHNLFANLANALALVNGGR